MKKQEWQERQAKLLTAFLERQKRREKKALQAVKGVVEQIDYDNQKVSGL